MVNKKLNYTGPGVYVPVIGFHTVLWYRTEDPDPLVGVQVDSVSNARKFANVATTAKHLLLDEYRKELVK